MDVDSKGRATIVDGSSWTGEWDLSVVAKRSPAVMFRTSWGTNTDAMFNTFADQANALGLPWIGYQFLDWRFGIREQADTHSRLMASKTKKPHSTTDLEMDPTPYNYMASPYAVLQDIMPETRKVIGSPEKPLAYTNYEAGKYSMTGTQVFEALMKYQERILYNLGVWPDIYSGKFYIAQWLPNRPELLHNGNCKFHLAWYADESRISVPFPWTDWWMWQYTGHGDGASWGQKGSKDSDESKTHGTPEQFLATLDVATTPASPHEHIGNCDICGIPIHMAYVPQPPPVPPPPPPIPSLYPSYKIRPLSNARVRSAPYDNGDENTPGNNIIGLLLHDTVIVVDTYVPGGYSHFQPMTGFPNGGFVATSLLLPV